MKKVLFIVLPIILATFSLFLNSCGKTKLNRSTTTSTDNNLAENAFNDVYKVVNETAEDESGNKGIQAYSFGNCATVTVDPAWPDTTFPKTVIVDFGSVNCLGTDGRERRGSITYTISDKYRNAGCEITVTPNDYYVNDYKIEGKKTITNNGRNYDYNINFTIKVTNGQVTSPEGDIITWESIRTREWIEGEETTFWTNGIGGITDDVYSITGNANGVNRDGYTFTVTIIEPLIVKIGCRWVTKGILEIAPEDLKVRTVNYGDGNCDNEATVEIGNKTYNITLR